MGQLTVAGRPGKQGNLVEEVVGVVEEEEVGVVEEEVVVVQQQQHGGAERAECYVFWHAEQSSTCLIHLHLLCFASQSDYFIPVSSVMHRSGFYEDWERCWDWERYGAPGWKLAA